MKRSVRFSAYPIVIAILAGSYTSNALPVALPPTERVCIAAPQAIKTVTGKVIDGKGEAVVGVSVVEKGTTNGTVTDVSGQYLLKCQSDNPTLIFSFIGFETKEVAVGNQGQVNVTLIESNVLLQGLQIVGSRSLNRSSTETPVAVDIIPIQQVTNSVGQVDVNQILQYVAPSFNSNKQSGADGADHIDPATLRGLGPDQTLVLVNGKRRHQSSLINLFGTRGRGNTGTDLNSIPAAAIERIEILRDGASAQYGSDAIAGVINIVLKTDVEKGAVNVNSGVYSKGDGFMVNTNVNYGWRLKEKGFINLTTDFQQKNKTNRPADPSLFPDNPRNHFGDASSQNVAGYVNAMLPLGKNTEVYAFGGSNYRFSEAYAWTRTADSERNITSIYPNGFDPKIQAKILDASASVGVRTKLGGWSVDLNNTFGSNQFHYFVDGSLNASLLAKSPTHFDAGGFSLSQNTTGINFTKAFEKVASGLNVAFGTEFRTDQYKIFAGEEASWKRYANNEDRPGGSQGFPGFQPSNELSKSRTNLGAYIDAELDITKKFLVTAAARYENYSDFGSTWNGKFAARYKILDELIIRGSASTGFRAPSLAQVYFNTTFTNFVAGQPIDQIIANNESPITKAVGIPALKQEVAQNYSLGFTAKPFSSLSITVDRYWAHIQDRIVLTGAFSDEDDVIGQDLKNLNVGNAQFFTNALDTKTNGWDIILTHIAHLGSSQLTTSLAGNFNNMILGDVKTTARLKEKKETYFDEREKAFLLASAPKSKVNLTFDYKIGRFGANLRFVNFAAINLINWDYTTDGYKNKTTTDLALRYELNSHFALTLGASNIFDVYPDHHDPNLSESGGMWDAVQMGFGGSFYFARLRFKF
ncbi:MAG: TonB-dependent receptor [Bacteroidota bacterium]